MRLRLLLAALLALPAALAAQAERLLPDSGWSVRPHAALDLWYHGMAIVGLFDSTAGLPLYNSEYVAAVRRAKAAAGIVTLLDSLTPVLQRDFRRVDDPELFHFMPLYFPRAAPERMLAALDAVARDRTFDTVATRADVRLGVASVAVQIRDRNRRRFLERFVAGLESEWQRFYRAYWERQRRELQQDYAAVGDMWRERLGPSLARFLSRARLEGGEIFPSPPLGVEGRLDIRDRADGEDNMVAVWFPLRADRAELATFAVLKELCFALVDDVVAGSVRRSELEALRGRAAVRCGALVLEFYEPTMVALYRRVFLRAGGAPEASAAALAFERLYPVPAEVYERLREAVRQRD